jgi:hypothetical protein
MAAVLVPLYDPNTEEFLFVAYADENTIGVTGPPDRPDDTESLQQTATSRTADADDLNFTGDPAAMLDFYLYNTMYQEGPVEELPDLPAAQQRAAVIVADPPPFVDVDDEEAEAENE